MNRENRKRLLSIPHTILNHNTSHKRTTTASIRSGWIQRKLSPNRPDHISPPKPDNNVFTHLPFLADHIRESHISFHSISYYVKSYYLFWNRCRCRIFTLLLFFRFQSIAHDMTTKLYHVHTHVDIYV